MNMPETVGVPLRVMVLLFQLAVTPAGRPAGVPMPVAPVVAMVIGVKDELIHSIGFAEGAAAVLLATTVMVPVAFTVPQPPVRGTE